MNRISLAVCCAAGFLAVCPPAFSADASTGKALFAQRCTVCHTAESGDDGGAQGPSLIGVLGRPAAGAPQFSYTQALRESKLVWDAATLKRFLAAPAGIVPGTSMAVAVPDEADRDNLIAYFQSVSSQAPAVQAIVVPASSEKSANWRLDAPGRVHRITVASLPPPFATPSSRNSSSVVSKPASAILALPPGFQVEPFATGLAGPRKMLLAPNGDVLVTEITGGRVSVLHPTPDGRRAGATSVYLKGLNRPFGLAFYPNAQNPQWLYVAETNRVTRYAYHVGDVKPRGETQIVVPQLPSGVGHSTRDIAFSPDGKLLFVSVGSGSNVAETMSKKTPEEIKSWEAQHGFGAAWDVETDRAAVLEFDAAAPAAPKLYASGIRNCVSLTVQPANGALWCTTNERDAIGDDLVPDYSTRVKRGSFYGWPWYYIGSNEDPRLKGERPDLQDKITVPDVLLQAHSAPLGMTFYDGGQFPAEYRGNIFAAEHGSWNRSKRTGHKIIRVLMKDGAPTGEYEDFATGFVVNDASAWGRPVGVTVAPDGSLYVSEDANGTIWRITSAGNPRN